MTGIEVIVDGDRTEDERVCRFLPTSGMWSDIPDYGCIRPTEHDGGHLLGTLSAPRPIRVLGKERT